MYEAYSDYQSMMNMAEEIVTQCALAVHGKLNIDYQVDIVCTEYNLKLYWSKALEGMPKVLRLGTRRDQHLLLV